MIVERPLRRRAAIALLAAVSLPARAALPTSLTAASPAADSVASGAPDVVELTFSAAVQAAASQITVTGPRGDRMDTGPARSVADEHHLAVSLRQLLPGRYRVAWRITTRDAQRQSGSYMFDVTQ